MTQAVLTTEQVSNYHRAGFITIDALMDPAEVADVRGRYDELFARASGFEAGDRIDLAVAGNQSLLPQIVNPERYEPQLVAGDAYRRARVVATQLLGDSAEPMGNHAILKPAHHGSPTPWHQDEAYWDAARDHRAISVWIPLQPATRSNGCMQFVPASHRGDVLAHRLIAADSHGLQLADEHDVARATDSAVACPIAAGDATVHDGRTLHFAGPNTTDAPRRALIFAFCIPSVGRATPRQFPWQRPEWFASAQQPQPTIGDPR